MTDEVMVGAKVLTNDGKALGQVKKVEEKAFQVDAPMAFDYWLLKTIVRTADAEKVDLMIGESDLGSYKMDNPYDHNAFQQKGLDAHDIAHVKSQTLRGGSRPRI